MRKEFSLQRAGRFSLPNTGDGQLARAEELMKTLFSAIILLLVLGISASTKAQTDEETKVREGEIVTVKINRQKTATKDRIKIQFVSVIEDSRCPADVNCIWAGNAKIKIKISDGRASQFFELNTNTGVHGATFGGYVINLINLTPTRKLNMNANKKRYAAMFEITRLTR